MPMTSSSRPVPRRGRAAGASRPAHADAFFRQIVAACATASWRLRAPGGGAAERRGLQDFRRGNRTLTTRQAGRRGARATPRSCGSCCRLRPAHVAEPRGDAAAAVGKGPRYTFAFVRDDENEIAGVAMFFKDLTRVEQLEERERLRDRCGGGRDGGGHRAQVKNPWPLASSMMLVSTPAHPERPETSCAGRPAITSMPPAGSSPRARWPPHLAHRREPIAKPLRSSSCSTRVRSLKNIATPAISFSSSLTNANVYPRTFPTPQPHLRAVRQHVQVERRQQLPHDLGVGAEHLGDRLCRVVRVRSTPKIL